MPMIFKSNLIVYWKSSMLFVGIDQRQLGISFVLFFWVLIARSVHKKGVFFFVFLMNRFY